MLPFGKTYSKTIIREIRSSKSRFLAIFAIITLGVGFLSGLMAITPDIWLSVDRYFRETKTMDIFIKGTAGLTNDDAAALRALPEVETLFAAYVMDTLVAVEDDEILVGRIYGITDNQKPPINQIELKEGRFPLTDNECLVQEGGGSMRFLKPETTIQILGSSPEVSSGDMPDPYVIKNFTVTGVVTSPLFLSMEREPSQIGNGRLGTVIYINNRCINMDVFTDFFITLNGTENLRAFSKPYHNFVSEAVKKIEELGISRSQIRQKELENFAMKELLTAGQTLNDGWKRLAEGERQLKDGEAELVLGREKLMAEERQARLEFQNAEAQLSQGVQELSAGRQLLAESKAQLDAVHDEVEETRNSSFRMKFRSAREGVAKYDAGLLQYEEGLRFIEEKERELQDGRRKLEEGRALAEKEFIKARKDIALAASRLAFGKAETAQARRDLEEGELKLEEGRRKANLVSVPEWYVLDRNFNVGYVSTKINASKIADISRIFPVFFMLVVALVSLTTMTSMVEEERLQIGVLKALGYQKRIISVKYIVYCALTGILGSFAGMLLGFRIIPVIVYRVFSTMFHMPPVVTEFNWALGLYSSAIIMGSTLAATIAACYQSMQEKPSALLRPRAPRPGKRILLEYIPFIWKPLKFTYKVSARNLIRHKKHFFMTITGIAGCTALILAGFGLRDSLKDIAHTQYQEILKYDLKVELHKKAEWDLVLENFLESSASQKADEAASASGSRWIAVHTESVFALYEKERIPVSVITPKPGGNLGDFINLRDRKKARPLDFDEHGAVLSEKLGEAAGLKSGSSIILEDAQGKRREVTLWDFTENYVGAYCYLGPDSYREIFGAPDEYETLLVKTGVWDLKAQDEILAEILASSAVQDAEFTSQIQRSYNNLLVSISFVVILLTGAAGGLAMIVLYNLTNININERSRELATLRVLGFHRDEAAFYIFREITILSILGAVAGLFLGKPLHSFIIGVAENPDLMFGRTIAPLSFVISAAATIGFSILVDFLMLKKISGIKMADSMKAGE